ncbi:MAG: transcription termination factor Rho [Planctomycetota bacterium]
MSSEDLYSSEAWQSLPFGAMERPAISTRKPAEGPRETKREPAPQDARPEARETSPAREDSREVPGDRAAAPGGETRPESPQGSDRPRGQGRRGGRRRRRGHGQRPRGNEPQGAPRNDGAPAAEADVAVADRGEPKDHAPFKEAPREERGPAEGEGMLVVENGGFGTLRQVETNFLPSRSDIFVPQRLIQQFRLRDGSIVRGRLGRGQKHKYALIDVQTVDDKPPASVRDVPDFKSLVTIDPDFHYAVGDAGGETAMRIVDVVCPIGRGQRALIVAPPRAGKTTILRQFAKGIEKGYPDVKLIVLLIDERPEEATEWRRSTNGQVFVSTADESAKTHVALAEAVWKRCTRLVELGDDVVLLLDSITRLARAYNNLSGGSGRTMSGGLDSQAMQRPRQIFGSARNTEKAGSLTILGTTLVETGSRMDQLIFEEFKGTGNAEIVLSRKLADRRIFPAIDIEKSGTRKEEKLLSARRLKSVQILRRVLLRMNFIEAMDLLVTKLDEVEATDDFLKRFEIDPDA